MFYQWCSGLEQLFLMRFMYFMLIRIEVGSLSGYQDKFYVDLVSTVESTFESTLGVHFSSPPLSQSFESMIELTFKSTFVSNFQVDNRVHNMSRFMSSPSTLLLCPKSSSLLNLLFESSVESFFDFTLPQVNPPLTPPPQLSSLLSPH